MIEAVEKYLKNNSKLIKGLILSYVVGAVAGALLVLFLDIESKEELKAYIVGFVELYQKQETHIGRYVWECFIGYFQPVFVIWVLGASLVGSPMIFIMPIVRGFISLFSITFFVICFGYSGMFFSLGMIILIEFIFVPALIFFCSYAINFSITIFKSGSRRKYGKRLAKYSGIMMIFVTYVALLAVCESYLFSHLLQILL